MRRFVTLADKIQKYDHRQSKFISGSAAASVFLWSSLSCSEVFVRTSKSLTYCRLS
jgi:hypothetical protein